MMNELISLKDFANLPESPELRFSHIESICRKKLFEHLSGSQNYDLDDFFRVQYMQIVKSIALELKINEVYDIWYDFSFDPVSEDYYRNVRTARFN